MNEAADLLYGESSTPATKPDHRVFMARTADAGDATPANVRQLRATDTARQIFDNDAGAFAGIRERYRDYAETLHPGVEGNHVSAGFKSFAGMARDMNLTSDEAGALLDRAMAVSRERVDTKANRADAWESMREEFGDRASQVLSAARKLATRDPRLARWLDQTGAGDDPQVIMVLARAAERESRRGRLK